MNVKQIASAIAKMEGKKHQASIGDVREIIKCLIKLHADYRMVSSNYASDAPLYVMMNLGDAEYQKKKQKQLGKLK